jgi:hypothetical protein
VLNHTWEAQAMPTLDGLSLHEPAGSEVLPSNSMSGAALKNPHRPIFRACDQSYGCLSRYQTTMSASRA